MIDYLAMIHNLPIIIVVTLALALPIDIYYQRKDALSKAKDSDKQ